MNRIFCALAVFFCFLSLSYSQAEPAVEVADSTPSFAVIVPERIDHDWYWILYSDTSQHIVQSAIEKALVRSGVDVIDISTADLPAFSGNWGDIMSKTFAVNIGKTLGVDYIVSGKATAVKASEGNAYGVQVVRTQANVTAKIIRVSDGRIMEVFDADVLEGGQSAQAAGQTALKEAGKDVGSEIRSWAESLTEEQSAP